MSKRVRWRLLLIVLVVAGMIAGYVAMGYANAKREWIGSGQPTLADALKKGVRLGLDLRGGIHLVLQVNTIDAVKAERDDAAEQLQSQAREQGLTLGPVELPTDRSFAIAVTPATDERKLDETVKRFLPDWAVTTAGGKWVFTLKDLALRRIEENAVAQAVETIRNRIDEFGVAEPLIARQGTDRILVQLPGIDDPKRVKDLIKSTAFLELKLVVRSLLRRAGLSRDRRSGPPNLELARRRRPASASRSGTRERRRHPGKDLKNARPASAAGRQRGLSSPNAARAEKFAKARARTSASSWRSSSTPREVLSDDQRADHDQGESAAAHPRRKRRPRARLRAGALPPEVDYLRSDVGPSLGSTRSRGITASVAGAVFVCAGPSTTGSPG